METELAKCPECGIKTVPDQQELTFEEKLCDQCYLNVNLTEVSQLHSGDAGTEPHHGSTNV